MFWWSTPNSDLSTETKNIPRLSFLLHQRLESINSEVCGTGKQINLTVFFFLIARRRNFQRQKWTMWGHLKDSISYMTCFYAILHSDKDNHDSNVLVNDFLFLHPCKLPLCSLVQNTCYLICVSHINIQRVNYYPMKSNN